MCRPVRSVLMNISSVQMPTPVFWSGVRFAVKLTPHGPECAVLVGAEATIHCSEVSEAGAVITNCSGWPDSMRDMSGSGPVGPILSGVWQSLQPPTVTRYSPRASRAPRESEAWAFRVEYAASVNAAANEVEPANIMTDRFFMTISLSEVKVPADSFRYLFWP